MDGVNGVDVQGTSDHSRKVSVHPAPPTEKPVGGTVQPAPSVLATQMQQQVRQQEAIVKEGRYLRRARLSLEQILLLDDKNVQAMRLIARIHLKNAKWTVCQVRVALIRTHIRFTFAAHLLVSGIPSHILILKPRDSAVRM